MVQAMVQVLVQVLVQVMAMVQAMVDTCTRGSNGMGSSNHKGTDMVNYNTGNISHGHGTSIVHTVPGTLTNKVFLLI